jgi:ABC-type glycerol-3-phosphate transport system permease component
MIFRAFIASIPGEIDETAIMDGASPLRVFFSIIIPLLQPAIVTVIVTSPMESTTTSPDRYTSSLARRTSPFS